MGCKNTKHAVPAPSAHSNSLSASRHGKLSKNQKLSMLADLESVSMHKRKTQHLVTNLVHEEFNKNINKVYDMRNSRPIGKGSFGTVRVATHRATGRLFALKSIPLKNIDEQAYKVLMQEVEVMKALDHPNIGRLQEVYHGVDRLVLVMDLYDGGELIDRYKFTNEAAAANIIRKVINAIRYCHDRHIAHRDLKLENILYEHPGEDAQIKVVDFGLGGVFEDHALQHDIVGSWTYMAPEVLRQDGHSPMAADLWAVGVMTHELLIGRPPYTADSLSELRHKIQFEPYNFDPKLWAAFSQEARDFVKGLLNRDEKHRFTAEEAQKHAWLKMTKEKGDPASRGLTSEVTENLRAYKHMNLLKRVAMEVIARVADQDQLRVLELEFQKADISGRGVITIEDFHRITLASGLFNTQEVDEIFNCLDVQHRGMICFTEFLAAAQGRKFLDEARLRVAFDRLDYGHTGKITAEQLQFTVGSDATAEELKKVLLDFDEDGNGEITFEDFCQGMRKTSMPIDQMTGVDCYRSPGNDSFHRKRLLPRNSLRSLAANGSLPSSDNFARDYQNGPDNFRRIGSSRMNVAATNGTGNRPSGEGGRQVPFISPMTDVTQTLPLMRSGGPMRDSIVQQAALSVLDLRDMVEEAGGKGHGQIAEQALRGTSASDILASTNGPVMNGASPVAAAAKANGLADAVRPAEITSQERKESEEERRPRALSCL